MILSARPGAHLAGVASAFPEREVDRATVLFALERLFPEESGSFLANLVERSGVETRRIVPTVEEVLAGPDFTWRNRRYRDAALELARDACASALADAQIAADTIDVLIDVSCTGVTIPALDVDLVPAVGLRPEVRRIPITESGCAAGALALSMAGAFAQTGARVLVCAVELCSLTLCKEDRSRTNLVASLLFGDGAAAAVIVPGGPGPRMEALGSFLVPASQDAMGFDVGAHGLRILLRRDLPDVLVDHLPGAVDRFLAEHGRTREDVALHLVHPGGRRILEAYQEIFDLAADDLRHSWESLRRYGNLSSVSILNVLEGAVREGFRLGPEKEALSVGVGPGLSLELALWSRAGGSA